MLEFIRNQFIPTGLRSEATVRDRRATLFLFWVMFVQLFNWEMRKLYAQDTGRLPSSMLEVFKWTTNKSSWYLDCYIPGWHDEPVDSYQYQEEIEARIKTLNKLNDQSDIVYEVREHTPTPSTSTTLSEERKDSKDAS